MNNAVLFWFSTTGTVIALQLPPQPVHWGLRWRIGLQLVYCTTQNLQEYQEWGDRTLNLHFPKHYFTPPPLPVWSIWKIWFLVSLSVLCWLFNISYRSTLNVRFGGPSWPWQKWQCRMSWKAAQLRIDRRPNPINGRDREGSRIQSHSPQKKEFYAKSSKNTIYWFWYNTEVPALSPTLGRL